MRLTSFVLCAALLLLLPALATAAMISSTFYNQTDADEVRFSVLNDAIGEDVTISIRYPGGAASGWPYPPYAPPPTQSVWFGDSTEADILAGTGSFTLWFMAPGAIDVMDFTLLWQEFSDGLLMFQDFDTYIDGQVATPTPIPASAWMLASGLALFIGLRRQRTAS